MTPSGLVWIYPKGRRPLSRNGLILLPSGIRQNPDKAELQVTVAAIPAGIAAAFCLIARSWRYSPLNSRNRQLLIVDGSDGLAFMRGGQKNMDDALLGSGIDVSALEEIIDLIVTQAECVFVGL